jgi:vacuolar-type H+-ATPase subunit D/Vma8
MVLIEVMASVVALLETTPLREVVLPIEAHLADRVLAHKHEEVHLHAVIVAAEALLRTPEAIPDHLVPQEVAVVRGVTDPVVQAVVQAEATDLRVRHEVRAEVTEVREAAQDLLGPAVAAAVVEEVVVAEAVAVVSDK